jgi:hypothetical protein
VVSSTHLGLTTIFLFLSDSWVSLMWGALSDERTGMPFTVAAGPRQRNYSWVWFPLDSLPYFTVSDSTLPQPGGPGPRIYIPQEWGGPVIPPGTGFSSRTNRIDHGIDLVCYPHHIASGRTDRNPSFHRYSLKIHRLFLVYSLPRESVYGVVA